MINCLKSLLFWPKSSSSSEEPSQSIIQRVKGLWVRISSYLRSTPTEDLVFDSIYLDQRENLVFDNIYLGNNKNLQAVENEHLQKWSSEIYSANKDLQYVFLSRIHSLRKF